MADDVIRTWDVAKLDIKPGQILVLRWTRPRLPGPGGNLAVPHGEVERVLDIATKRVRAALDDLGFTHDKVPVLATTEDWDLLVINPLDLLDACATAAKNEEEPLD